MDKKRIINAMPSAHYISSTYVKLLIQANRHLIPSLERTFDTPLSTLLNAPFIDADDIERLIQLLHKHGLDSWVLRHGKQLGVTSHGPLGFAALSAPDLGSAIEIAAEYSIIRLSYYACELRHDQQRTEFIFQPQTSSTPTHRWMVEAGIHVVKQLIETIVAHPLGNNAVINFSFEEPQYKTQLQNFYAAACNFNQQRNSISIPSSWCQISSPLSDPSSYRSNLRKCQELKQQLAGENEIVESSRLILRDYFELRRLSPFELKNIPSLSSLAQSKHMTTRTFARRLAENNYSYRKLVEEVRREQACNLLLNTHLNIADISSQLGYLDSANFIRAFKSWFNYTPAQWRKVNH